MKNIKLIVGLGNPGSKYSLTRHNAGAWYIKLLSRKYNKELKKQNNFFGYFAKIKLSEKNIYLLMPTTYMNLSGKSVLALANFYYINPIEILVAHDELDLMPGKAKIKLGSDNSGHNGVKDIKNKLDNNFYRLRIGVGHPGDKKEVTNFLLSKPSFEEQDLINRAINEAVTCTSIMVNEDIHKAINQLHAFKA